MRPATKRVSSATFSGWIVPDRYVKGFALGVAVQLSSGANLTYSVQHTLDDLYNQQRPTSLTRSGTTATVVLTNHGLSTGDWNKTLNSGDANLDGEYSVTFVDANTYTYTVANTGATVGDVNNTRVITARVTNNAVLAAQTADGDTNYAFPPTGVRLLVGPYVSGFADLTAVNAGSV